MICATCKCPKDISAMVPIENEMFCLPCLFEEGKQYLLTLSPKKTNKTGTLLDFLPSNPKAIQITMTREQKHDKVLQEMLAKNKLSRDLSQTEIDKIVDSIIQRDVSTTKEVETIRPLRDAQGHFIKKSATTDTTLSTTNTVFLDHFEKRDAVNVIYSPAVELLKTKEKATTNAPLRDSKGHFIKKSPTTQPQKQDTSKKVTPSVLPQRDSKGHFLPKNKVEKKKTQETPQLPLRDSKGHFIPRSKPQSQNAGA